MQTACKRRASEPPGLVREIRRPSNRAATQYDGYLFATSEAMLIASASVRRCIDDIVGLINPMFIPGFAGNRAQQNLDCVAKITEFLGEARSELSVDLAE